MQTIPWIVKGRATRLLNTDGRSSSSVVSGAQASEIFSYDELGRVKINSQCTPQTCGVPAVFPINYTYDLLGDTLTATNGEGVTLTYGAYNRALRITGMTSSLSNSNYPGTLYSSPHYNAAGSVTSAYIGNPGSGVSETRGYDGRLRVDSIADGSIYTVTIPTNGGYAPDSDILLANDSVNGNWTYGYDAFNRLASANATGQAYTYAYDRFGNRWQQNGPHSSQPGFDANNHMVPGLGVTYDAAGNETNDGTTAYTYDSENRIIAATNSGSGASSYLYDADGRRIRKASAATGTRDYLYDLSGHETTQVMSTGVWARGEVYVDGRHLATYVNATTYFNFSDWLGTERARALTGTSTACETMTSLPFGDGQTTAGSCGDPSFVHFTGKERDSESGLDNFGARYDSSQFGRFMTPDKFSIPLAQTSNPSLFEAILSEPQNWDQYSYAHNNPIIKTDLGGLLTIIVPGTHWSKKDWNTSSGFYKQVSATFHEQAVILDWSGGLSGKARSAGARQLNDLVKNHKFAAGEQLNIVAHSNGGNVAFEASQTVPHKIDNHNGDHSAHHSGRPRGVEQRSDRGHDRDIDGHNAPARGRVREAPLEDDVHVHQAVANDGVSETQRDEHQGNRGQIHPRPGHNSQEKGRDVKK